jgi:pyrimidine-nucleoside phosphorylase
MIPQETIERKRDGKALTPEELREFFSAFADGTVAEYQMSAFLMAVHFQGMNTDEISTLTDIYLRSGTQLDLSAVTGAKVDKHSTGGVGDKTSLLLLPIVAAAGVNVPMISGRGLAHTGGTLDKFESIPGFRTDLTERGFIETLQATGMAVMGQTERIVPIEKRIYALRDVTATVPSIPLIVPSIMSKKIAGGADALVLDIKIGAGAFMKDEREARALAERLVETGEARGMRTVGFLTAMDEPLGKAIGNWLEVVEAVDCLIGRPSADLMAVAETLAGTMIWLGRKASSVLEGITIAREMVASGLAYKKFLDLVAAQDGDTSYIEETMRYRNASAAVEVPAPRAGFVSSIDARALGFLALELGAGRRSIDDAIDPTAGIVLIKKTGDAVDEGEGLCRLYSSRVRDLISLRVAAERAFNISSRMPAQRPSICSYFDREGFVDWNAIQQRQHS